MSERFTYQNRYGSVELETIEEYRHVSTVYGKDVPPEVVYSLSTAEQLVLITENRHIQIGIIFPLQREQVYILKHASASQVALCRIVSLKFVSNVCANDEIAHLNRAYIPMAV